jgi:branched-chain amino acid transport system permease protein
VGGLSTVAGPVLGATFLTIMDELLRPTEFYRIVLFGVIVILTVLFMPGGLESIPRRLRLRLWKLPEDKDSQKSIAAAFGRGRK